MNRVRKYEIGIGVLFLLAMVSYIVGSEMVDGAVKAGAPLDAGAIRFGVILELVNSAAVVGIAALFWPLIRPKSEPIAAGYFGARVIEAALLLVCSAVPLTLAFLPATGFDAFAPIAIQFRPLLFQIAMITLGVGSVFLTWVLFRDRMVPRWLALFGLIGYPLLALGGVFELYGVPGVSMWLLIPGSIFEVVFPIWLFWKGMGHTKTADLA